MSRVTLIAALLFSASSAVVWRFTAPASGNVWEELSPSEASLVTAGFVAGGQCVFTTQCVPPELPPATSCVVRYEGGNPQAPPQLICTNIGVVCAVTNTSIPRMNEICTTDQGGMVRDPDVSELTPPPNQNSVWGCTGFNLFAACITYQENQCFQLFTPFGVPNGCGCLEVGRFGLGTLAVCQYGWNE
jgi:hypothetical protein